MNTYIISYDLRKIKNYPSLIKAIQSYGIYAKILESLRAIKTSKSASQVGTHLTSYIDQDDGLFVLRSGKEAVRKKVLCTDQRLKTHL